MKNYPPQFKADAVVLCTILGVARSSFCYRRRTAADRAARQAADAQIMAMWCLRAVCC